MRNLEILGISEIMGNSWGICVEIGVFMGAVVFEYFKFACLIYNI